MTTARGDGGYVYEIRGMPTWDVNKALEGRVPGAAGTFSGNPVRGELENVVPVTGWDSRSSM